MAKRVLTEPFIKALKPAAQRYGVSDAIVPGLRVNVTPKGVKTFILWRRVDPRATSATGLTLGRVGVLSLAEARTKARQWLITLANGEDPRAKRGDTFASAMERYLADHVRGQRKAKDVEYELRKDCLPRWGTKPLAAIRRADIIAMIDDIKARGASAQARNVYGHMRTFCNWAIEKDLLASSPCDHISMRRLLGPKLARQRVLNDGEIAALWRATGALGYPFGELVRLLLLTGVRRDEAAHAAWSELDLAARTWTIPRHRYKSDVEHVVPLNDAAMELLGRLPRWAGCDYLFSASGRKPLAGFAPAKKKLDALMGKPPHWCLHDLRRVSRMSELHVADVVAELALGHSRKGLAAVYDRHKYRTELAAAFAAWGQRLGTIVAPRPANVVALARVS
jgi:integrase